jgi:hypothetical protein
VRRIGVLMNLAADDKEGQARLIAFVQALSDLGWKNVSNVQIDTSWGAGDTDRFHQSERNRGPVGARRHREVDAPSRPRFRRASFSTRALGILMPDRRSGLRECDRCVVAHARPS